MPDMGEGLIGMCETCGTQTGETVFHLSVELCPSCRELCCCMSCSRNADIAESVRRSGISTGPKK